MIIIFIIQYLWKIMIININKNNIILMINKDNNNNNNIMLMINKDNNNNNNIDDNDDINNKL